jgi:GNAT superfamily N-acetyltransferase
MLTGKVHVRVLTSATVEAQSEWYGFICYLQAQVTQSEMPVDMSGLRRMSESDSVMLLGLFVGNRLISMVQATLIPNLKNSKVFLDSVATDPSCQGQGQGKILFHALEEKILKEWPSVTEVILTNGPRRGNGGFYESLGYQPRADRRPLVKFAKWLSDKLSGATDETYVWVKQIE